VASVAPWAMIMHGEAFARTPKKQKWMLAVIRRKQADLPFELPVISASGPTLT
jgi:hypothetical protein